MAAYLHGMHDPGGEHLFGDKPGWIVHTIALRHESQGNFNQWQNNGITSLVRLNYDHDGVHGTIPQQSQYADFAKRCANYVAASPGCNIVIIGNEPNHAQEWPEGVPIQPEQYASCFNQCYTAIKASRPDALVLVAGVAPWNTSIGYDWLQYFRRMCEAIRECDGFAIHGYTHGSDPNLIFSLESQHGWRWHFPVIYQTMQNIPSRFATLDCYVTETNQGDNAWLDNNNGWVKAAFESVDGYNGTGTKQRIRALCLYRWKTDDKYAISNKPGVQADFRDAVARGYLSPSGSVPIPGPTPEPSPEPTPPTPAPDDGTYLTHWDTRLDARGTTLTVQEGQEGNLWETHIVEGYWYDKDQAQGRTAVYIKLIDEFGNLIKDVPVSWFWSSGADNSKKTEIKNDPWIPGGQYSIDFSMYNPAPSYGFKFIDGMASDVLNGMGLGDLAQPDYNIHTAYYFVAKRMPVGVAPEPPDPEPPDPPIPPVDADLVHPLSGARITQHWGELAPEYAPGLWGHDGTDFGGKDRGTPIACLADGVVVWTGFDAGGYGNYVRVQHNQLGICSFYAHLERAGEPVGKVLRAGEPVGKVGSTGNSTGPHLHLEIRMINPDGSYKAGTPMPNGRVDPETWCIVHGLVL